MDMANIHALKVRWSKVKIDVDKDMNGKSLTNLNEVNAQIFSPQNGIQIIKSPERGSIRILLHPDIWMLVLKILCGRISILIDQRSSLIGV